jgi:hypothetical protein
MIVPGKRRVPVVLLIGFVVIILSLVFLGIHRRRGVVIEQSAPLHQE